MKKYFVFICCMFLIQDFYAQNLLDIYKKGTVKLVPDAEYAQGNQWDKVFETYYDTLTINKGKLPIGDRKSIVMMPDGSLVISHDSKDFYTMFDAKGKFVKEFGIKDKSGKFIKKIKPVKGVINNHFYTEFDNMGKMVCFDFEGNYVKTLTLDYNPLQVISLPNNKIAAVSSVQWSDRSRLFVVIVDYNTNAEKIIWDYFYSNDYNVYEKEERVERKSNINNKAIRSPKISLVNDKLMIAFPDNGEILIYDLNGNLKSKQKVEWEQKFLSVEEQKEMRRKSMEKFSEDVKNGIHPYPSFSQEFIDKLKADMVEKTEKINSPSPQPLFSNIIKDSDGNILFFEMPETEGGNKFNVWVYQDGGKFICQSSFVCDDYELSITPSKMVFYNGYIYSLQILKNAKGNPLRLVRFKLE